ncbi:MAG: YceI family protein [Nannocystaceae bacterium]
MTQRTRRSTFLAPRNGARLATVICLLASLAACKSELDGKPKATVAEGAKKTAEERKAAEEPKKGSAKKTVLALDPARSKLGFVGAKITGDHKGEFKQLSGKATFAGEKPVELEIIIETASVETDAEKLTGHLKSADFFAVEKFPKAGFRAAKFVESKAAGVTHEVTGELDLHGVKKTITFPASISVTEKGATGKAEFTINRKDFGIVYPGKPDDLIKDDVLLKLDLSFI